MTPSDIANIRLHNQKLLGSNLVSAKELVGWMGAMQAQDYAMAKWAMGVRLPNATDKIVGAAIDSGEVIRTHLMRPTWHLVAADDIYWMLELTAPQIRSSLRSRNKELELTEAIFLKSSSVIEKALAGNIHLTRDELKKELTKAKIKTDDNRASHLLLWAELNGTICSGATKNNKQTYALLEERVLKRKTLIREEALATLTKKYFLSHAPATLQDFVWWSGLPVKDARQGLEMNKKTLTSVTVDSEIYWLPHSVSIPKTENNPVHLLPAFDEFIISYKNRSATINIENHKKAVSNNGIFRPIIVINGQITGIWKRAIKKDKVIIETTLFRPHSKTELNSIEEAAEKFGDFLKKKQF